METEFACPICLASGDKVRLIQNPGKFGLYCSKDSAHIFQDTQEFLASNPVKIPLAKKAPKVLPGMEPFNVMVHKDLIEALSKRFGTSLQASIGALLGVMTDSGAFVVTSDDTKRLREILEIKINSADVLVGGVYNLWMERNQLKSQVEQKGSGVSSSGNSDLPEMNGDYVQTTVRISTDAYMLIREKAKFNGLSFSGYIQQVLSMAVQNGWV